MRIRMNLFQEIAFKMTGKVPDDFFAKQVEDEVRESVALAETKGVELDLPANVSEFMNGEVKSITIGDVIPISARGRPIVTKWTEARAIRDGLKVSVWVFACIHRIAKSLASIPWVVEQRARGAEDEWEPVKGRHPLATLINRPNPFWSRQDLFERAVFHLLLGGNALFTKIRARGEVRELWLISPDFLKPIPVENDIIRNYLFSPPGQGKKELIDAGDVIHVMITDPSDPYWGMSPLKVIARDVDSEVAMSEWQLSSFRNNAVPSGVLVFNKSISPDQKTALEERVDKRKAGPGNARKTMILSGREAAYHQLSLSPVEMDFLNSRKATREAICSGFGVPQVLVGVFEDMALANANVARLLYWEETVIPFAVDFQEALNRSLAPEFGDDIRLAPDFSKVPALRELLVVLADTADKFWKMGVPFDQINARLGLGFDSFPGSDVSWIQSGMTPADLLLFDAAEPDPGTALPTGDEDDPPGDGDDDDTTDDPLDDVDDDAGEETENPLEAASSTIIDLLERKAAAAE